ncbi:MAG: NUDIX hydrolase [Nitrososphaerales archaeon]
MIYTVDEAGNLLELAPRETLHLTKSSKRHAAVIGMILRGDGKFLIQWRAKNKLGGERLDVSATTHVRRDETYETALQRSFQHELAITKRVPLQRMFDFKYTENLGDHMENEYCKVFFGRYEGDYSPNSAEIDSVDFMALSEVQDFVRQKRDKATKWLRETIERIDSSMI